MLNASVGVQRVIGRLRRPPNHRPSIATDVQARSLAAAHQVQRGLHSLVAASRLVPEREARTLVEPAVGAGRRTLIGRLGPDRAVAVVVAGILLGASVISVSAARPAPATGGPTGPGVAPRLAIGGERSSGALVGDVEFGAPDPTRAPGSKFAAISFGESLDSGVEPADVEGPFIDDGTLVKPIAVDTTVPDGSALVKNYEVKAGDTLDGIAATFGVSTMSVWWANNLKSKTDIHLGQVLRIPPVTGLIVKVAATDTLEGLAARYGVNGTDILVTNGLDDPNLVVGQVLVVPGAKGKAIPTPKPTSRPTTTRSSGAGSLASSIRPPDTYAGGTFLWPVVGGGNYISQYYHYGHYGLDIAADYGSTVRAAGDGIVTHAGWVSGGGGYAVWIAHGSGLYTTYNHMSAVSVAVGQHVGRGDQVGRIGQSGNATGPHLHFEVWRGPIWDGGRRVNPLGYL